MTVAPLPEVEEPIEEVGEIRIGHGRVPVWLLLVIAGIVAWGLFYLIQFSVNDAGSFSTDPTNVVGSLGL